MQLRQLEASVLELLKQGKTMKEAAAVLRKTRVTIANVIGRLTELRVLERTGKSQYKILIDTYEIVPDSDINKRRSANNKVKVDVPKEFELYLRTHYERVPRRELANHLGVDKVTLNFMLLQIGCGE